MFIKHPNSLRLQICSEPVLHFKVEVQTLDHSATLYNVFMQQTIYRACSYILAASCGQCTGKFDQKNSIVA